MIYFLESDESSEVACMAIEGLEALAKSIGPILFERCIPDLTKIIDNLLRGKGKC
jgi:hypothetical protein